MAYERFSAGMAIGEQIGKGGKLQVGADPWESLTDRVRHFWETFAGDFAREIIQLHQESTRRVEAEKERKAMRADLFEREVQRRIEEALVPLRTFGGCSAR